jgi:hypothetical protein
MVHTMELRPFDAHMGDQHQRLGTDIHRKEPRIACRMGVP